MANITRGFTFSSGDLVTAAKLHSLVDSASVSGVTQAAMSSGSNLITSGGTAPGSPAVGQAWWDTSTTEADGNGILKIYDGTRWQSASKNQEQALTNRSGESLTHGDVVVLNTSADNSVTTTTTEASTDFLGIAATGTDGASTIGDQSEGRFVQSGLVVVNTTGTVARGDYLGTSGTVKLAKSLGASPVKGAFGRAIKNTATDKWLVLMSGETLKPMGVGEPVELTTTAKRMLDASDITDQDLGYSANNFAVVGTIGSYDPSTGSGESEVWLDILVTPQFAEPIHLRIEGDLTLANINNSSQVDNLRMFEYSSTSLATTKAELRDHGTDLIGSGATPLIRFTQEAAVDYTAGVKVNRTYVIPNTATTDRHFKILYAGGNGGANPVSLAGVLIFEQWKVV
mgnify:CR=1 FL=1